MYRKVIFVYRKIAFDAARLSDRHAAFSASQTGGYLSEPVRMGMRLPVQVTCTLWMRIHLRSASRVGISAPRGAWKAVEAPTANKISADTRDMTMSTKRTLP